MKTIEDVERALVEASAKIGDIHECNAPYTYGLARIIWELGKPVEELTVKDLMLLHQQHADAYNRLSREVAE
jgi:hypothetical protein